jgi:aryl-alcohol dehydrogenase-like predicted oxidoreductase
MTFGSQVDRSEARRMVDTCLDRGINFLDTANAYNKGESERIVGECIRGRRDNVILASKVFNPMPEGYTKPEGYSGLSRVAVLRAVDDSLARLGTDYLDLYYLHQPDRTIPIEESLEAVEALVKAGKVRFPALSNYASWQVVEAQWIAARRNFVPVTVTQPMYNLLARGIEQEFLPMCRARGVFTCIYNPLAGGLLTGKQQKDRPLPGSRFDNNASYLDRYWHPAAFEAVAELSEASERHGRSLISTALTWIYNQTTADCIIMGGSSGEQICQNLNAIDDAPLPPELIKSCDAIWAKLRGIAPQYNR